MNIGYAIETGLVWIAYKLYTTELFPTVVRTIALNTFSSTSLFGSMLTPQLIYLKVLLSSRYLYVYIFRDIGTPPHILGLQFLREYLYF